MENLTGNELQQQLTTKKKELERVKERLTNPMASDETIRALHKTQNELIADIQAIEIRLQKQSTQFN